MTYCDVVGHVILDTVQCDTTNALCVIYQVRSHEFHAGRSGEYIPNRVTRDLAARMNSSVLMLPLASIETFSKDCPLIDSSQEVDMMKVYK